jgi:hypothetical protein
MRTYIVQAGDSPANIASKPEMAGCPKCASRDLVPANPHKETVIHPNGFVTFKSLRVGEKLNLPDKWFEPGFDLLPPAYFGSLPYADGVTPSPFGELAPVVLRDFKALDVAADKVRALLSADNEAFARHADHAATAIHDAIQPALASSIASAVQYAQAAESSLKRVIQRAQMLRMSLEMHATEFPAKARADVQNALADALSHAQHAIRDLYATLQPPRPK